MLQDAFVARWLDALKCVLYPCATPVQGSDTHPAAIAARYSHM